MEGSCAGELPANIGCGLSAPDLTALPVGQGRNFPRIPPHHNPGWKVLPVGHSQERFQLPAIGSIQEHDLQRRGQGQAKAGKQSSEGRRKLVGCLGFPDQRPDGNPAVFVDPEDGRDPEKELDGEGVP